MSRRLRVPGVRLGEAELEQDVGAQPLGGRLRQRAPQVGDGRVRSAVRDRGPGGRHAVTRRPSRPRPGRSPAGVPRRGAQTRLRPRAGAPPPRAGRPARRVRDPPRPPPGRSGARSAAADPARGSRRRRARRPRSRRRRGPRRRGRLRAEGRPRPARPPRAPARGRPWRGASAAARPTARPRAGRAPRRADAAAAVGSMPSSAIARTSSWTRNGTPPVTSWHALAKRRLHLGPEPEPHELGHRLLAQRCERKDLGRRGRRRAPQAAANPQRDSAGRAAATTAIGNSSSRRPR